MVTTISNISSTLLSNTPSIIVVCVCVHQISKTKKKVERERANVLLIFEMVVAIGIIDDKSIYHKW